MICQLTSNFKCIFSTLNFHMYMDLVLTSVLLPPLFLGQNKNCLNNCICMYYIFIFDYSLSFFFMIIFATQVFMISETVRIMTKIVF